MPIYFTLEERLKIESLLKEGKTRGEIASALKRPRKSISTELQRRSTSEGYSGQVAHQQFKENLKRRYTRQIRRFSEEEANYIDEQYALGTSIRLISTHLAAYDRHVSQYLKRKGARIDCTGKIGVIEKIEALEQQVKMLFELFKELKK